MPVLLLCYGDKEAKDLLRQAIEARYGQIPPVIESLVLDFKGRSRVKIGPVTTWVPVDMRAAFHFPLALRLDFTVRPLRLPVQRGSEAFDGAVYRSSRGSAQPSTITDEQLITSTRRRLWAMAAILLTPLSESYIKLTCIGENSFEAANTKLDDAATLVMREQQHTLKEVRVRALNPDSKQEQDFTMQLSDDQRLVGDLMLPQKISAFWDGTPYYEVEPIRAQVNPTLSDSLFTLQEGHQA